jgi:hypothetical protein
MSIFLRVSTGPGLPMSSPGDDETDSVSKLGLDSLSRYLFSRTALEPGTAMGVDIETDQLALYPLIYWPMSEDADMPSPAAISRIDAYMKSGGTVLFDTRDRIVDLGGGSSALTLRLQQILASLDIPPLEPVPADHVLTKSFFLLETFPGRYSDGPLWVEAIPDTNNPAERPARTGDGVSSILITGNDMARGLGRGRAGLSDVLDHPGRPLAARICLPGRGQHRHVHADRQLQG